MPRIPRPAPGTVPPRYAVYVDPVPAGDLAEILEAQALELADLLAGLSEAQGDFRYAPGKWSIKDLLLHVADTERVMGYRLLCFARGDQTALPGFDENAYARAAQADARALADLAAEFAAVRGASLALVRGLDPEAWPRQGTVNATSLTASVLAFVLAGHAAHHIEVLKERYLPCLGKEPRP